MKIIGEENKTQMNADELEEEEAEGRVLKKGIVVTTIFLKYLLQKSQQDSTLKK